MWRWIPGSCFCQQNTRSIGRYLTKLIFPFIEMATRKARPALSRKYVRIHLDARRVSRCSIDLRKGEFRVQRGNLSVCELETYSLGRWRCRSKVRMPYDDHTTSERKARRFKAVQHMTMLLENLCNSGVVSRTATAPTLSRRSLCSNVGNREKIALWQVWSGQRLS